MYADHGHSPASVCVCPTNRRSTYVTSEGRYCAGSRVRGRPHSLEERGADWPNGRESPSGGTRTWTPHLVPVHQRQDFHRGEVVVVPLEESREHVDVRPVAQAIAWDARLVSLFVYSKEVVSSNVSRACAVC